MFFLQISRRSIKPKIVLHLNYNKFSSDVFPHTGIDLLTMQMSHRAHIHFYVHQVRASIEPRFFQKPILYRQNCVETKKFHLHETSTYVFRVLALVLLFKKISSEHVSTFINACSIELSTCPFQVLVLESLFGFWAAAFWWYPLSWLAKECMSVPKTTRDACLN